MKGRNLMITRALVERERGTYASVDVLAEAKRMSVPEMIMRVRNAIMEGRYALACSLTLDMVVEKTRDMRVARGNYHKFRRAAMDSGDTGEVFELEVQWDSKLGFEGEEAIVAKGKRMIRDALYALYQDSNGAIGHAEWKERAEGMREALLLGITERIQQGGAEFVPLTVEELDLIGKVWMDGMGMASEAVQENERPKTQPKHAAS